MSTLTVTVKAWYSHEQINLNTGKNVFADSRWVLRLLLVGIRQYVALKFWYPPTQLDKC